jgi:hypothetical protein
VGFGIADQSGASMLLGIAGYVLEIEDSNQWHRLQPVVFATSKIELA